MTKPIAALFFTREEIDLAMDGCMTLVVKMRRIRDENADKGTAYRAAYDNAAERYSRVWDKLYDARETLPIDIDS